MKAVGAYVGAVFSYFWETNSTNGVQYGIVPERPDISYRWSNGGDFDVTLRVQGDDGVQTLQAQRNANGEVVDSSGNILASVQTGSDGQRTLVVDPTAVDAAIAELPTATEGAASGRVSSDGLQTLYVNPETGDVTYAPPGATPPGYVPVSGTDADQVGAPRASPGSAPQPASQFEVPNRAPSPNDPGDFELGYDPSSKRFRASEVETAWRLQHVLQQSLVRDSSGAGDWIAPDGKVYDAVGPANWRYFNADDFNNSIDDHLLKSGVVTVIDMTGAAPEQIASVKKYLARLPADAAKKIVRMGF